ncbi:Peptide methionine sulfoxide reductase MsrA [Pseudomonas sp. 8BK]|uniref:Peptide methionine sulfoxide reductase MsrA n=1 Tax=Pseudomonas anguilliseptica TaxID=53406 RepID=A0A1H5LIN3_PSEAG|nr:MULTISPECIES: peptide-methionine (S)-S-oxide reductase MsrA [Pseudomonas]SEE76870.1 peptide-methionine (S)-S-oxide reductase [Pseudomonas anguilliseptica]VXC34019.1 Peptide methionine sulfoxide reductase MsrA [Pseudomonas sp. 8BK]
MTAIPSTWRSRLLASSILALGGLLAACEPTAAQAPQPQVGASTVENPGVAIFAGGCFWCTESDFDKVPGVIETTSGYIGGHVDNPTYEQVSAGTSGHIEAVQVRFDPSKTSYAKLLEAFWPTIDPITANAQFCDRGPQYRSAIFYSSAEEQQLAEASKAALEKSGRLPAPVVTEILAASTFYPAEDYHQDYYQRNPLRYNYYRNGCGRDQRLEKLWGKKQ